MQRTASFPSIFQNKYAYCKTIRPTAGGLLNAAFKISALVASYKAARKTFRFLRSQIREIDAERGRRRREARGGLAESWSNRWLTSESLGTFLSSGYPLRRVPGTADAAERRGVLCTHMQTRYGYSLTSSQVRHCMYQPTRLHLC